MKHQVTLNFFQDDANGEYGLTHHNTCGNSYDNAFNAFWSGIGIFHDVFEHYHEFTKYFTGDNALNVGGEMVAMGAMWYYYDVIGLHGVRELSQSNYRPFCENMRVATESMLQDAIYTGYCQYGNTLNSGVPKQRPTDNGELEYQIAEMVKNVKGFHFDKAPGDKYFEQNDYEYAMEYKRSCTFRKIADLHRYGFRMGQRLIPDNTENQNTLRNFITEFNDFCKYNNAEEMYRLYSQMVITVTKRKGIINYTVELISRYPSEIASAKLKAGTLSRFSLEDQVMIQD